MKIEPRRPDLDGLFKEWLIRRQKGNPSTPEELRRDCPELLDALKQRAAAAQENNEPLATPAQSDTGLLAAAKLSLGDRPALPDLATQSKFHNLRFHAKGGLGEVWIAEDETLSR